MASLELLARLAWKEWAAYQKFTSCDACGEQRYCGAARRRTSWLCVDCFDLRRKTS